MKRLFALALVGTIACTAPTMADTVKLVTGNDYKPFTDESLPEGGLFTDIVRTAYEEAGHNVSIEFMPWKRGAALVEKGKKTATFPYVDTPERKERFLFSDPVYVVEERPFVTADNAGSVNSYDDMAGMKDCIPLGWSSGSEKLQELEENGTVERNSPRNMTSCFKMLKAGRVDFVPIEVPNGYAQASTVFGSRDEVNAETLLLGKTTLYLMFPKGDMDAAKIFNEALASLRDSGKYQKIIDKHLNR